MEKVVLVPTVIPLEASSESDGPHEEADGTGPASNTATTAAHPLNITGN